MKRICIFPPAPHFQAGKEVGFGTAECFSKCAFSFFFIALPPPRLHLHSNGFNSSKYFFKKAFFFLNMHSPIPNPFPSQNAPPHHTTPMSKPTLPETYVVPEVWQTPENLGGKWGGTNRPTAGAREEEELQRGVHDLQLYSLGTPNGMKVTILLEELGIEYDAWKIPITGKQFTSGFVAANPNSKIPAMLDYGVPGEAGEGPLRVFESGSILVYLAEKHNRFLPTPIRKRTEVLNWVMWQMGGAPFIGGGFGHFYNYAPVHIEYAVNRYAMETKRQLDVLDKQLEGKDYVCGEYSIADMAIYPWIGCLDWGYNASTFLGLDAYKNVARWCDIMKARKAVARGVRVNGFRDNAVTERHSKADFADEDY